MKIVEVTGRTDVRTDSVIPPPHRSVHLLVVTPAQSIRVEPSLATSLTNICLLVLVCKGMIYGGRLSVK